MPANPDAIAAEWEFVQAFVKSRMAGHPDAEDVAAGVIERALRKAHLYEARPDAMLRSWLYTIARNAVTEHARWSRHRRHIPLADVGLARLDAGSSQHADILDVRAALAPLDDSMRDYADLIGQGMTQHKAARRLGIAASRTTAWRRGRTCMTLLRVALEPVR